MFYQSISFEGGEIEYMNQLKEKICFILSPIGSIDSPIREHANLLFNKIILPVTQKHGYFPLRADHIPKPGMISQQIIDYIVDSSIVIADLTGYNPNVFYELAIRHATKKPVIHMIKTKEKIPFDVFDFRTIEYDFSDDGIELAKNELEKQIKAIFSNSEFVDNPISLALGYRNIQLLDSNFKGDIEIIFENNNNHEMKLSPIGHFELPSDRRIKKIDIAIEKKKHPKESTDRPLRQGGLSDIFYSLRDAQTMMGLSYGPVDYDSLPLTELEEKRAKAKEDLKENDLYEIFEEHSYKINFIIVNTGKKYILDASIKVEIPKVDGIIVAKRIFDKPTTDSLSIPAIRGIHSRVYPEVEYSDSKIIISSNVGKIRHHLNTLVFEEPIRIIIGPSLLNKTIPVKCIIYGENLPEPIIKDNLQISVVEDPEKP